MGILIALAIAGGLLCAAPSLAAPQPPPAADRQVVQEVMKNLSQENYEEALELLRRSWERGPRTAEKAYLLGQVNRRLLRYTEARANLEEALRLQPHYPEAQLLLADTLIALDQPEQAEPYLQRLEAAGYQPGQTSFLLGMAAFKQKRFERAATYFRRAQQDPRLAQDAKFQESMALAAQDKIPEAQRTMREAVSLNPRTATGGYAQGYLAAMEMRLKEVKRFRANVALGFDYDSNVTLQPGSEVAAQQVSGQGDVLYTQLANLEYNVVPSGPFALWASYGYFQTLHRRLTKFDMISNTAGLTPAYTFANSRLWMPFTFNYTDVESDKYYTSFLLAPTYLHLITPKIGLEVGARFSRFYYWFPFFIPEDNRSGRSAGGSLGVYYFLANQEGYVQLRFGYDHYATSGSNWDNNAYRLTLGGLYPLTSRLKVRGFVDLAFQPYTNTWVGNNLAAANPKRDDTILILGAEATYNLWKGLELNGHYFFIRNNSNIALYDYNRHIIGMQLGYRY